MEDRRNRSVNDKNRIYKRSAGARRTLNRRSDTDGITERIVREELSDAERRRRLEQKRKIDRLRRRRMQALVSVMGAAVIAVILLFMTPIFDIQQIKVVGNNYVGIDMIEAKVGELVGENIFRTRVGSIEQTIMDIPQIDDAEVTKHYLPPSITIKIKEAVPAAYVLSGNTIVVVSSDLKIIDDSNTYDHNLLPSISGVSVSSYELNKQLVTDSAEKEEILHILLSSFSNTGLLNKVTYISVEDITDIRFNYDNRIEVLCGSQLELERKVRMFAEALNSETMKPNSLGTMDLSLPGRAVYTP